MKISLRTEQIRKQGVKQTRDTLSEPIGIHNSAYLSEIIFFVAIIIADGKRQLKIFGIPVVPLLIIKMTQ